jgi:uncharacterized protein YkwD
MKTRTSVLGLVLVAGLMATPGPASAACSTQSRLDSRFAAVTNAARNAAGAPALRLDPHLSRVADLHSYWMDRKERLFHSNRLGWKVTNWSTLGENVGVGSSIASLQSAFMNSPSHRQNVLDPNYRYVGVSVRPDNGRLWVTVVFESHSDPGTRVDFGC